MKYYLVATIDTNSKDGIVGIQKFLNKKYRVYKTVSNLYIPLGFVNNTELDKLDKIIQKVLSPYKKFKVGIDNTLSINDTSNTINLKVKDKGYINQITRSTFDMINLNGIACKNFSNLNFYTMPISNANNSVRKAFNNNTYILDTTKDENEVFDCAKIGHIEIWKQLTNKRDTLIKSYELRDY